MATLRRDYSYLDQSMNSWIPQADQSAFKIAFYNALVLAFLGCCLAVVTAVFCLLHAVLKPMLWAILCGTVLFPFKKRLTTAIEWYIKALKDSGTPLFVGIIVAPLATLDRGADALWSAVVSKSTLTFLLVYTSAAVLTYGSNFNVICNIAQRVHGLLDSVIWLYSCGWVRALALIYGCCFVGYVYLIGADANKVAVRALSVPLWVVVLCTISQFFGPLRVFVAVGSGIVVLLIVLRVIDIGNDSDVSTPQTEEKKDITNPETSAAATPIAPVEKLAESESFGNRCIRGIIGACSLLWVTRHPSALALLVILFVYGILKKTGEYFDMRQHVTQWACNGVEKFHAKFGQLLQIFFPSSLRQFFKLLFYGDRRIADALIESAGTLSTIFVMTALLVTSCLFGGFLIFQLQSEARHLITITSSVINQSFSSNINLPSWISKAMKANDLDDDSLDTMVESAYGYGREWLPTQARLLITPGDTERADLMESQVRLILDKLYESWEERGTNDTKAVGRRTASLTQLWEHLRESPDIRTLAMEIISFIKENVGTLMSILETVWSILTANLTFLFSISAGLLGIVLTFSMEILSTLIGISVFLTVMYYLLAYSRSEWKPVELLSTFTPGSGTAGGNAFSKSVETAISNVFILSFKMAVFYGLYMWFIHTLFALNVTFIPSIFAAMLAAVPFLAPYWVCIPGAIELGLVRGEPISAVLFFVFGFAPSMLVDTAFYKEVKGSHPYLTGLSVVGGIYWLGLEGAFIGPILLCCMLVLMDMYRNVLPH